MGPSRVGLAMACVAVGGWAQAQPIVEKPSVGRFQGAPPAAAAPSPIGPIAQHPPSRFYGTARPPVITSPPPSVAPPVVTRPPVGGGSVYVPPPVVRPHPGYGYGYAPRPRVGVDVWVGSAWPRSPYWYGPGWGHPGWGYSGWGAPWWGVPPTLVVPPPVVVSPPAPVVYVERPPESAVPETPAAPVPGFWYWCAQPQGFYPEVGECPQGWQAVPPRAAAQ